MPKMPDLSKYSLDELNELKKNVDKEIANYEKKRKAEALKAIQEVAKQHGVSLAELVGGTAGKAKGKSPAPAKYRNPDDPDQTWSGRGRQPEWYKSQIAKGKKAETMEV